MDRLRMLTTLPSHTRAMRGRRAHPDGISRLHDAGKTPYMRDSSLA